LGDDTPGCNVGKSLEQASWNREQGRAAEAEPLLAEASAIFEKLAEKPWLERLAVLDQTSAGAPDSPPLLLQTMPPARIELAHAV
jgi:hypothetical protein